MTLKQKFDSIDQSKLNSDQKDFLGKIEKATKNFTSDNKEVNNKVEGALDKMIATFKEKMPEVIKTKESKKEPKSSSKPSRTSKPKRTVMSVAKEIRKDGESWADAQKRARAEINKDKKSAEKEVKTEMQKLMAFIKTRKELEGISGTDLGRDSSRSAKKRGARVVTHSGSTSNQYGTYENKLGRKYWESRDRHSDRLAPNYPKDAPLLENGAYLTDPNFGTFQAGIYKKGGMLSPRERYNLEIKGMTGVSVGAIEKYIDENDLNDNDVLNIVVGLGRKQLNGADVSTAMVGKKGNAESKRLIRFVKDDKAMKMELGGNVGGYDLAGHLDGTFNVGQNDGALSGITGTQYSGLVGETGAMSAGEMFSKGGAVKNERKHVNHSEDYEVRYAKNNPNSKRHGYGGIKYADGGDFQAGVYANGGKITKSEVMANMYKPSGDYYLEQSGNDMIVHLTSRDAGNSIVSLENKFDVKDNGKGYHGSSYILSRKKYAEGGGLGVHGLKEGDQILKTLSGGVQKIKDKKGDIVYVNLANGERSSEAPLPFNDGGKVPEFIVNKDGIRVSKMVEPKKKISEKEWMAKHNESKEARAYKYGGKLDGYSEFIQYEFPKAKREANKYSKKYKMPYIVVVEKNNQDRIGVRTLRDFLSFPKSYQESYDVLYETTIDYEHGGNLETNIKSRLAKNFNLPLEVAVYVPSTKDADEVISEEEFENRVESVQKYLSDLFGGFSSNDVDGGYMSQEKGLITEEVYKVISFAQRDNFSSKMEKLVAQINKWAKDWGQESIGLEFEGDLFYIDQKGDYKFGGMTSKFYSTSTASQSNKGNFNRSITNKYNDGGEINAFSMRMVKGTNAKPDEVLTENQEVKFAGGGKLEKRQAYLDTLADKEADIWDKLGAESGGEIRQDKDMLRNYALKMEAMLKREEVGKGSLDEADYDHLADMNAHLMNEFLVWNNYYEPEMTVREKKWRTEKFPDSKYRNYVADPEVISLSNSKPTKADKYIVHADIKFVTVKKDGKELKFKGSDVLNGANILKNGGELSESATYYPKRSIVSVELKDGKKIKPSNGYWIKKNASEIKVEKEYKVKSNVGIFPKKGTQTYWYVENSKGQTINRHTDKPYRGKEMDNYIFYTERNAESFAQRLNMSSSFETGGKVSFAEKSRAIARNFKGKRVEPKYQKEYGKTYDAKEAKEVGDKIAGAQKANYDAKAEKGAFLKNELYDKPVKVEKKDVVKFKGMLKEIGVSSPYMEDISDEQFNINQIEFYFKNKSDREKAFNKYHGMFDKAEKGAVVKKRAGNPNAGSAMILAKKIRKDGEKWTDALKRANAMIKNK